MTWRRAARWFSVWLPLAVAPLPAAATVTRSPDQIALVDSADARWYLWDPTGAVASFYFGLPGDLPLAGDWDCDGVDTPGMFRPSNGFIYLRNTNSTGPAHRSFFFGIAGDLPLAGDWDGDGCDSVGVFRSSQARMLLTNRLETGFADSSFYFGTFSDQPLAGDFDGDGDDDVALARITTGTLFIDLDLDGRTDREAGVVGPVDTMFAGDWNVDGVDTPGAFRGEDALMMVSNQLQQAPEPFAARGLMRMRPVVGWFGLDCRSQPLACGPFMPELRGGDKGAAVVDLKTALAQLGFRPGSGPSFDSAAKQAVYAFQKHHGLTRDGVFRSYQWDLLSLAISFPTRTGVTDRLEVDLGKQVLYFIQDDQLVATLPISSGNGDTYRGPDGSLRKARTPEGRFSLYREADGWYESYLGSMYEPFFFSGGYALHGSSSVPAYPASHGCVRLNTWDMDWLKPQLDYGTRVYVFGDRVAAPAPTPA